MKTQILVAITAFGMALAAPVSAHHNSPWGEDGIEIGDMQGMHEEAFATASELYNGNTEVDPEMDPADSMMPDDIVPQPEGVNIPDDATSSGPVNGAGTP